MLNIPNIDMEFKNDGESGEEENDEEPPSPVDEENSCFKSRRFAIACIVLVMMTDVMLKTCITLTLPVIVAKLESVNESWFATEESLPPSSKHHSVEEMRNDVKQKVAWAVAINPVTESLMNLLAGFAVDYLGNGWPMIFGALLGTVGSVGIAFSPTYAVLIIMRMVTGTACSFSIVSCLAFTTSRFPDDEDRRGVINYAYVASNVGNVVGNAITGLTYEYLGTAAPFLCISGLLVIDGIVRCLAVWRDDTNDNAKDRERKFFPEDYFRRLEDPCVVLIIVVAIMASFSSGFYKASIIEWELHTINGHIWQVSAIHTICIAAQALGTAISSCTVDRCGHAVQLLTGFGGLALSYLAFVFCQTIWACTGPELTRSFFCGLVFFAMPSLCSLLAQTRHSGKYGIVLGLFNSSLNVGIFIGAITSGLFASTLEIHGLIFIVTGILLVSALVSVTFFKMGDGKVDELDNNEP